MARYSILRWTHPNYMYMYQTHSFLLFSFADYGSTRVGLVDGFLASVLSVLLSLPQFVPREERFDLLVLVGLQLVMASDACSSEDIVQSVSIVSECGPAHQHGGTLRPQPRLAARRTCCGAFRRHKRVNRHLPTHRLPNCNHQGSSCEYTTRLRCRYCKCLIVLQLFLLRHAAAKRMEEEHDRLLEQRERSQKSDARNSQQSVGSGELVERNEN